MLDNKILLDVIENYSIIFNESKLLYSDMLRSNIKFITDRNDTNENQRLLILHPGTNIFIAISTVLYALKCLILNDQSSDDTVKGLSKGDSVIYQKRYGVFDGFNKDELAVIRQGTQTCYVPAKMYYKIIPYNGNAKTIDGRGIKDDYRKRRNFLSKLLNVDESEIPAQISRSIVVVCEKQIADMIANETSIIDNNGNTILLNNIFAAAYYTANDIYYYSGNSSKMEPVLKFTSKISVARELIIDDSDKSIVGLLVNGKEVVDSGISELTSLLPRRSLKNICILSKLDCGDYSFMLQQFSELQLFAWTSNIILANKLSQRKTTEIYRDENQRLLTFIDNIINCDTKMVTLKIPINSDIYSITKRNLIKIANNDYTDNNKEFFVIIGFSLLNLFTYSIFPMRVLENLVKDKTIAIISPASQFNKLKEIAQSFEGSLGDEMRLIVDLLYEFYNTIYYDNPKNNYIFEKMISASGKKMTLVVPKAYYADVFSAGFSGRNKIFLRNIEFITANKFENEQFYDEIIVVGTFSSKRFNPFNCNSTAHIEVLTYDFEKPMFIGMRKSIQKINRYYNTRNYIRCEYEEDMESNDDIDKPIEPEVDLEEYINAISLRSAVSVAKMSEIKEQSTVEVKRVAIFETSETIFFSKNYIPYVFDVFTENVYETDVDKLSAGDILVFANKNNETRDIVDDILVALIQSEKCDTALREAYEKSKYWKLELKRYIERNKLSYRELSEKMKSMGHKKHEVTLRSWLDEDSYVIGPRDSDSYIAIALLTEDKEMLKNPDTFCEACNLIRSTRIRILKHIGISIINSISKTKRKPDELFASIIGDATELSITLQIEEIIDVKDLIVPVMLVNSPQKQA